MSHFAEAVKAPSEQQDAAPPTPSRRPAKPPVLQRRAADRTEPAAAAAAAAPSRAGLPSWIKAGTERLSGLAMDDVRVHRNSAEPAKLGALAFARGCDIHLGPGQEQHLPHEAWHVVQQKQGRVQATSQLKGIAVNASDALEAEADRAAAVLSASTAPAPRAALLVRRGAGQVLQKKDPKPKPTVAESELALGQILRRPEHAAGLTLAFYDVTNKVAVASASEFAKREHAIAHDGAKPTAAGVRFGKALDMDVGVGAASVALAGIAASALARVPPAPGVPAPMAMAPAKIKTLAIFGHGEPFMIGPLFSSQMPKLVKTIAPKLSNDVTVIFYACGVARSVREPETWIGGTMEGGGKRSLAALARDALVDEKITGASVWGNAARGRPAQNVTKRVFEAQAGKGAEGESFVSKYIFTASVRDFATRQIAETIRELGYTIDETDPKFVEAAAAVLRNKFYYAFLSAGKELPGVNVAEEAPLSPRLVALKVAVFWAFTYWPREREAAAAEVIRRLRLKKPAKP